MENRKRILENRACVCLLALLCCLLWGSAFPCVKIGYRLFQIDAADTAAQMLFAGVRFSLAGALTVLFAACGAKRIVYPKRGAWGMVLLLGLIQTVLQYVFFYIGLAHASGVKSSIIMASNTFIAILISGLVLHQEPITARKMLGCLVGFAGVVLINLTGGGFGSGMLWNGEGFVFLAAVCYAISSVLIKQFSRKENPVILSGYQFLLGGVVLIAIGLAGGGRLSPVSPPAWLLMLYMGALSAIAYSLWSLLLQYNPVSTVTVYGFSNPVFGVLLSMLLLKETNQVSVLQCFAALLLVCVGIGLVNARTNKSGAK